MLSSQNLSPPCLFFLISSVKDIFFKFSIKQLHVLVYSLNIALTEMLHMINFEKVLYQHHSYYYYNNFYQICADMTESQSQINYHKLSGISNINLLSYSAGGQKQHWSQLGYNQHVGKTIFLGVQREPISLLFPVSRSCLLSWTQGPFPPSSKPVLFTLPSPWSSSSST